MGTRYLVTVEKVATKDVYESLPGDGRVGLAEVLNGRVHTGCSITLQANLQYRTEALLSQVCPIQQLPP